MVWRCCLWSDLGPIWMQTYRRTACREGERETSVMSCVSSVGMSGWVVVLLPEMGRLAETKEVFYLVSL